MTKDEKNRAIAEWLEPEPKWTCGNLTTGKAYTFNPFVELEDSLTPRDFITSEEASALVLEKMPMARVERTTAVWVVYADWRTQVSIFGDAQHYDRKTAIAEAALALIQREKSAK